MNNIIYISSNLDILKKKEEGSSSVVSSVVSSIDRENSNNNQLVIDNKLYLPLSLPVYGWLRQQMDKAHVAYKAGNLAQDNWDSMRHKFYPVHDWAVATYGKKAIEGILETVQASPFEAAAKQPTTDHRYPTVGEYSQFRPVSPKAVAQVDSIRDVALSLGWTENGLYQNRGRYRFPCGDDYGLVCFLDKGGHIGEVTRQYIEIIGTSFRPLKFYNQNVEQPWLKKTSRINTDNHNTNTQTRGNSNA